jgi:mediator of RNA polymerase II transcription subunit 14
MASSPASHSLPGHHNMAAPSPALSQSNMPDQSPAMFSVNSPATQMHAPSPSFMPTPSPGPSVHMPSPNPNFMQAHDPPVNSPFHGSGVSIHSPAAAGWPGSPSIPRPSPSRPVSSVQSPGSCGQPLHPGQSPQPSQVMMPQTPAPVTQFASRAPVPQRNYLISTVPTILTAKNFDVMCQPLPSDVGNSLSQTLSQLERFLGCVSMKRHLTYLLQRAATSSPEESVCLVIESGFSCQ